MNEHPTIVRSLLEFYADHVTPVSPGEWRIRFTFESNLLFPWSRNHEAINRCGAALVNCLQPLDGKDPRRRELSALLIYPATHAAMRELFGRFDFGRDLFVSAVGGKHPEEEPNTPDRVSARRAEALRIFDAMGEECPVFLSGIGQAMATLRFAQAPDSERVRYWAEQTLKFHRGFYVGDDPEKAGYRFEGCVDWHSWYGLRTGFFQLGTMWEF